MRPSWVEVDLGAIRHNVRLIKEEVAPAKLCVVVKADGYGHGDVPVAEAAMTAGADWLAVALVEEGVRLREAGLEGPILLLSEPPPDHAGDALEWGLKPTVYTDPFLEALTGMGRPAAVHLKVDTGMHRVGADPVVSLSIARTAGAGHLELEGVWTHMPVAESDTEFTKRQVAQFGQFVGLLRSEGLEPSMVHAANSAGALAYPEARFDMVRCGLSVYGLRPAPHIAPGLDLRPAMRVVSQVSMTRRLPAGARPSYGRRRALPTEATVATVPIGYADGLVRRLGEEGGEVLIRGRRYPFAGTVTMDHIVVDVDDADVEPGDEVVVLGAQGDEAVPADEWARRLDTINYEIVCNFGPRLPRRYRS